jgi:hypothetical protein
MGASGTCLPTFYFGALFLATADPQVEADHPVLVPGTHHGNVAGEKILTLNDLLRTLRDIGAIGKGKVVGEFLFNRNLGTPASWIGFRGQSLRVDLDPAHSKELLHAVVDGRVERLVDDQIRGFIGK